MSRALARLRETTGDPLLVRAGRGLVPTPRALELRERVSLLVQDAEAVLRGLPSIGVAKNVLCGQHETPGPLAGERTPLIHRGEQIGWALRSKPRCNPLIVSPGHRVSMQTALEGVLRTLRGYRLPEPTRLADRIASRRG
mgnify:CR=1 FL=1